MCSCERILYIFNFISMKKLLSVAMILAVSPVLGFSGAGYDREGNLVDVSQNVSRTAVTIKGCGIGASQRDNLYLTKCKTRYTRMSTRATTSNLLTNNTAQYRASKANSEVPTYKAETLLEKFHRILAARRANRNK